MKAFMGIASVIVSTDLTAEISSPASASTTRSPASYPWIHHATGGGTARSTGAQDHDILLFCRRLRSRNLLAALPSADEPRRMASTR